MVALKIEIENQSQQRVVLVCGEIDSFNVEILDEHLTMLAHTSANIGSELLDLRQVTFMSVGAWVRVETYIDHAPYLIRVEPSQAVLRVARIADGAGASSTRDGWMKPESGMTGRTILDEKSAEQVIELDLCAVAQS